MASELDPLTPLVATLRDLLAWWQEQQISGLVIGGVAASVLGHPRVTRDVDGLLWLAEERWGELLASGPRWGFVPRVAKALDFARESRVLLLEHQSTGIHVDISLGSLPFEQEAITRALQVEVSGLVLPLPAPEELIVMKAVAHRPRDLADIGAVLEVHPKLDLRRMRRWLREFAAVLEMPEILDDFEKLLASQRKHERKGKA